MRATCPNCSRRFNCEGGEDCWCLKVERKFDYEDMILRTGATGCACPVCVTGRTDLADVESLPRTGAAPYPVRRRRGRRRQNGDTLA